MYRVAATGEYRSATVTGTVYRDLGLSGAVRESSGVARRARVRRDGPGSSRSYSRVLQTSDRHRIHALYCIRSHVYSAGGEARSHGRRR